MQSQILPSRAALVDRIALQFEYGQNLICLLGPSGLGKSYLLETFITDKYLDFNKAFVQLSGKMTDQQLMTELLEQSFSQPLIDHALSLSENFYQLYKQQPCGDCLWVVDGGRHLSEESIQQLEILAKHSPSTLYILIASQSVSQFSQAVEIHLEALNLNESKQLMRWFFDGLPVEEDPVFRTFLQEAHGNPALLLAWQPEQQTADLRVRKKSNGLLYLILLLLTTMLLIIGFLYKADMTEWWKAHYQQNSISSVATALPAEAVINGPVESKEPVLEQTQDDLQVQQQVVTNDADNTTQAAKVPVDNSVIENRENESHNNNVAAIVDSLLPAERITQVTEQPTTDEVVAVIVSNAEQAEPAIEPELPLEGNAWYLSQPDDNLVIQLLAVTKQEVSDKFINENGLRGQVNTYQTLRSDKPWWIVTYGSFATLNDAKKGITTLSDNVRKNQPFYKKISKIKQEIASLNQ